NKNVISERAEQNQAASKVAEESAEKADRSAKRAEQNQKHGLALAGRSAAAWHNMSEAMGSAYERFGQYMIDAVQGTKGVLTYMDALGKASKIVRVEAEILNREYDSQKSSADYLLDILSKSKNVTLEMLSSAERSIEAYSLLGDQQLGPLRSAVTALRSDMDSLTDSLESTVDSLRNELDQLNGDTAAIQDRAYNKERDRLTELAAKARQQSNDEAISEANTALQLLEQTYQIKSSQAQEQKRQEQVSSNRQSVNAITPTSNNRTITIEMGGQSRTVSVADVSSENELISLLEGLQAVSLS
ncbi:MAG: hypothetical protein ACKVJE_19575, partial [Pseudomonadales bacterium]